MSIFWESFNTTPGYEVEFVQPNAQAIAVNRILDASQTRFNGSLKANGQVYLINPNGVVFGHGSHVNVGGLVASALDVSDADLSSPSRVFSGSSIGSVANYGDIKAAPGGYVAFLGSTVENYGSIAAPGGTVALGAGSRVTLSFAGSTLAGMQVDASAVYTTAQNIGRIEASGGAVVLSAGSRNAVLASVVNNSGYIEANTVANVNGSIVLEGGGNSIVANNGTLNSSAPDAGGTGGSIKVLGDEIRLTSNSFINVLGHSGGGVVLVGGNFQGSGPERNAQKTTVSAGASIMADATWSGNGGRVAIRSDGTTHFNGAISAWGAGSNGRGGHVETSGNQLVIGSGARVGTLAPNGPVGDWLLNSGSFLIGYQTGEGNISDLNLSENLGRSNVTIKTATGDITLAPEAYIGWMDYNTLTLNSYRHVNLSDASIIDASSGWGNIVLRADNKATGTGTITIGEVARIFGNHVGAVEIYYNPTSYYTPTDYKYMQDSWGQKIIADNLRTYMLVNVEATALDRVYNGGNGATVQITPRSALPNGVSVDTTNAYGLFADKNVGSDKPVTIHNVSLTGMNPGQYALNGLDGTYTASISKADVTLTGITAIQKTYDGTTAAYLSGTARVVPYSGDILVLAVNGRASFSDKNVGTGKAVTLSGYSLGGRDAGNYNLLMPTDLTASISKANLALTGISAANKTYDGTTVASLLGSARVAAFGNDVVSVAGEGIASFSDKNAKTGKAVTVSGYSLDGRDAGNYNLVMPTGLTASISMANLALTGITAANKTYDGTRDVTFVGTPTVTPMFGDDLYVTSVNAHFSDKNVGTGKRVTVFGIGYGGADAANYNLIAPTNLTANISKANLALTGVVVNNKTYDGTTVASLSGRASVAAIGRDVVSVSGGAASFADKNAGSSKAVTVSGYTLSGTDADNYNLVMPTGLTATIGKADLAVFGVTANNKTYDGTTVASLAGSASVAAIGSDVVSVSGGAASFADKNAGSSKAVTVSGYTLSGTDADNYNLVMPTGLTATIDRADLAVTGLVVNNKTYDGTNAATFAPSGSFAPVIGDDVTIALGDVTFADKNAGSNKAVSISGYTASGADAKNYNIILPTGLTAGILRANLFLTGLGVNNKTYDGTTTGTLSGTATVAAFGNDKVSVSGPGIANFADKNVGTGKAVTVGGYALSGADAGNYNLLMPIDLTASISKANLALTGLVANNKIYDGGASATLSGSAIVAAFGNDDLFLTGNSIASFTDKNAGANKAVAVSGYTLSGADADNYNLLMPSGLTADIARANLAISGVTADDKIYDSTTIATLSGSAVVSAIGSDVVAVSGSGVASFADKNVGAGKAVTVGGYTLSGADAGNYNLLMPTGLTANINRASLSLSGITADDRIYDGSRAATLSGNANVSGFASDDLVVAGTGVGSFADKNAGAGKAVSVSGYVLEGADASNYDLIMPTGLTATIGRADLAVFGVTANSKIYDGTTEATLTGAAIVSAIEGDIVSVAGNGIAAFADKNVGTGKAVIVDGYTLTGADAGNYAIVQPSALAADISKASLAIRGLSGAEKVYDGTTAATLNGTARLSPFANDAVNLVGTGSAAFSDKNVGADKAITVTGFGLAGADAGNYELIQPVGLTGAITPATLVVSGIVAQDKTFDGTTSALVDAANVILAGKLDDDLVALTSRGEFEDPSVGSGKTVLLTNVFEGADLGNYTIVDQRTALASINALPEPAPAPAPVIRDPRIASIVAQIQFSAFAEERDPAQPTNSENSVVAPLAQSGAEDAVSLYEIVDGGLHLPRHATAGN